MRAQARNAREAATTRVGIARFECRQQMRVMRIRNAAAMMRKWRIDKCAVPRGTPAVSIQRVRKAA